MTASQFVLVYDVFERRLVELQRFDDPEAAAAAVVGLETRNAGSSRWHVVMLASGSEGALRKTHGTYFDAPESFLRDIAEEAA